MKDKRVAFIIACSSICVFAVLILAVYYVDNFRKFMLPCLCASATSVFITWLISISSKKSKKRNAVEESDDSNGAKQAGVPASFSSDVAYKVTAEEIKAVIHEYGFEIDEEGDDWIDFKNTQGYFRVRYGDITTSVVYNFKVPEGNLRIEKIIAEKLMFELYLIMAYARPLESDGDIMFVIRTDAYVYNRESLFKSFGQWVSLIETALAKYNEYSDLAISAFRAETGKQGSVEPSVPSPVKKPLS